MNSVKLACSSSAYADTALVDAIRRIADIGYPAIGIYAGHEQSQRDCYNDEVLSEIKEALTRHRIAVANISIEERYFYDEALARGTNDLLSNDDIWADRSYIELIKYYVKLARELNCTSVSVSPGRTIPNTSRDSRISSMLTGLVEVMQFARGLGVAIGVSYGPGLTLGTAADLLPVFPKCRGLKLAFHVGRSHLACETPCNIAKDFKHRINHVYIADVGFNKRPYLVPGAGEIEWISFFKTLRWIGYQDFVTVDLSSYQDMPDSAAQRAFFYLSNIINGLKPREMRKSA